MATRASLSTPFAAALLLCCSGQDAPKAAAHGPPAAGAEAVGFVTFGMDFGAQWHDGKAELAGYALTYPRYGQLRRGTAVAIFVTEPFTRADVKPEDPKRADFPVIKLNLVQDFQTGIYDYNLMTSAFVTAAQVGEQPAGSVRKVSFSSQEWCGHVYAQVRLGASGARFDSHSYFEGEADQRGNLEYPPGGFAEDALWLWARGLGGPALDPGQRVTVPLLDSLEHTRLRHAKLGWGLATLSRAEAPTAVQGPDGTVKAEQRTAEVKRHDGSTARWQFWVEQAAPHRILRIERDDGYVARLLGARRLAYWKLNSEGGERYLRELGLRPPDARGPNGAGGATR
ncbi:MAG: hypothetical protein PVI30_05550 [Myxococcales bacterium]|jgi:hypothetical protein